MMSPTTRWRAHSLLAVIFAFSSSSPSCCWLTLSFAFTPSPPPSWEQLRSTLPDLFNKSPAPVYYDRLPDDYHLDNNNALLPILYRDKECICAASETVWLALECKNVNYITVLVSIGDDKKDDTCRKPIPRIVWPDDKDSDDEDSSDGNGGDAIQLLEQIQNRYPNNPPNFYPKSLSAAVDVVRCNILRLPGVMPRYSDPEFMSLAPYIFKEDGSLVQQSSHCVTLEEIEEMQEEYYLGKFLCGRELTAADIVWAPYLERYAIQLPLIFSNAKRCNPRTSYEEVNAWYTAMETKVPAYACRVQGDARHWRKCLERVLPLHNARAASDDERIMSLPPVPKKFGWWMTKNNLSREGREELWKEYATESRPWLADTPGREVALYFIRNCEEIVSAATLSSSGMDLQQSDVDEALREIVQILLDSKMTDSKLSECSDDDDEPQILLSDNARRLARFACERIEVPRDMGMIPVLSLGELIQSFTQ